MPVRPTGLFGFLAQPPTLARIVARGWLSCALAQRAELDAESDAPVTALLRATSDWLEALGLLGEAHPDERAALAAPPGVLSAADLERLGEHAEVAGVVAWALQLGCVPAVDVATDASEVAIVLGWQTAVATELQTSARLRARTELMAWLDFASAVHWRVDEQVRRTARIDLRGLDGAGQQQLPAVTPLHLDDAGDLLIGGQSLADLPPAALLATLRRARARHRAALWLLGQQREFADIETP